MIELPDDELDKLFRKSSEELDPQFDPSDWISLKKRLDKQDGKTPAAWFRKWWPLVVLAVLIPAGIATYFMTGKSEINGLVNAQKSATQTGDGKVGVKGEREESGTEEGSRVLDKDARNQEESNVINGKEGSRKEEGNEFVNRDLRSNAVESRSKILPRSRSKTGGVYLEPNRSKREGGDGAFSRNQSEVKGSETRDLPAGNKSRLTMDTVTEKNDPVTDKSIGADVADSQRSPELANPEAKLVFSVKELNKRGLSWKKPDEITVVFSAQKDAAQPAPAASEKQELAKWAVRFGYSPDLSSVGLKNFSKPGSAVSLMVEYALLNKLFVQTGITRSVKEYNAKAGEYIWPSKYPQKVYPDNVDGTCNIFEVPLNFRYDLSQNERSRWFAGAGSSSYYMQKEKYVYNYKRYTHGVSPGWKGKTGWYLFSHINASAGYEYRLSKKLSMLAEPYVRIPVKRVGYGKVNLFTTGIWISVRYTPVFK